MDQDQIQQEITIIKEMIDKTRRETAESGNFLVAIGIYGIFATLAIGIMEEVFKLNNYILPAMILNCVLAGVVTAIVLNKSLRKEKVKTYARIIFYDVFFACGITSLILMFLFPLTKVYPFHLVPTLVALVLGIAVFSAGAVFESPPIKWCSIAWWGGAILLAYAERGMPRVYIFMAIILFGWVLPGMIMNKKYKNRSKENGS